MNIRILVVDDNPETLRSYVKAIYRRVNLKDLSNSKFSKKKGSKLLETVSVETVLEAIEKLRSQSFDILVVDLKIPGLTGEDMGGLEIISESLKLDSLRPIIVITGYGTIELARKTLTQGVFDFIEKSQNATKTLVDAVQRAINLMNEKIKRTGNPFTPITGMAPTVFGGRTEELEFLEEKLNRALYTRFREHFLILGKWGIGKSTMLKEFKKIIQSRGYLVALHPIEPFQKGTKLDEVARAIVEGILRDLPYPIDRFKKLLGYFDSIGFSILGTGFEISRNTSKKMISPQTFLHDTILNLWHDLKSKTEILVILLDNLENLMYVSEIILTLKQALSMDSILKTKILVGMATTSKYWKQLTSQEKHHPLSRYFLSKIELMSLNKQEVIDTIIKSLGGSGVSFNQEIIEKIFFYTKGHPFEMQLLCYHLFNNQLSGRVKIEIFEKSLEVTIREISGFIFEQEFEAIPNKDAAILRLIAQSDKPVSESEVYDWAKTYPLDFSLHDISTCLLSLVKQEFIKQEKNGYYNFLDPMFRLYIQKFK